jgi:glycopeptide antibiotics resistance protein
MIGLSFIYILFVVRTLFLTGYDHYNFNTWFNNLFGNIILFIPFGFSTPYFSRKLRYFKRFILFILVVTVTLEDSQMFLHAGSLDIDDIILNSLGGIIGFVFYKVCLAMLKKFKLYYDVVSASNAG